LNQFSTLLYESQERSLELARGWGGEAAAASTQMAFNCYRNISKPEPIYQTLPFPCQIESHDGDLTAAIDMSTVLGAEHLKAAAD